MKYYHKKMNMICFDPDDLKQLFEAPTRAELLEKTMKSGYSGIDLLQDRKRMKEIVESVKIIKDKEDVEIFTTLYGLLNFYPNSKICFLLKNNGAKDNIGSLSELKAAIKENDLTDFSFLRDDGLRPFQLKTYKGKTAELPNFIKKKLSHYGNSIGEVNLLFLMQSDGNIEGAFFQDIYKELKGLKIKGSGHILIFYNEANQFIVINTVYPILATTRIKILN